MAVFKWHPQDLVSHSVPTSKPILRRNKCSHSKGHRSADLTEVHPDRTPLVGQQPLIGWWWCHHPEECVKGFSCSRETEDLCHCPWGDLLTSSAFSSYISVQPQGCSLLMSKSLHYKCWFNPVPKCDLTSPRFKPWAYCVVYSPFQTFFTQHLLMYIYSPVTQANKRQLVH